MPEIPRLGAAAIALPASPGPPSLWKMPLKCHENKFEALTWWVLWAGLGFLKGERGGVRIPCQPNPG